MKRKEWETLSLRLTRYAFACTRGRSWADAENMSQEALADLIDPRTRSWDPEKQELFVYLGKHVRNQLAAARMSAFRRRMQSYLPDDGFDHDDAKDEPGQKLPPGVASPARAQDEMLIAAERDAMKMARIQKHFAKDQRALEVLALLERRVLTIAEHAEHLGCSHDEAFTARRRLAKFVSKLNEELNREDGENHG